MRILAFCFLTCAMLRAQQSPLDLMNGNRPMADAHNCYPYEGKWSDRLERALGTDFPIGIEQDLAWAIDSATGQGRPVVTHTAKTTGAEPTLREHFFERVRPIVEKALAADDRARWPLITLHFDFKDNRPELLQAVWELLGEYEGWITTAVKTADPHALSPYQVRPLLVLTEDNDAQEKVFFTSLAEGSRLRLFGSVHTTAAPAGASAAERYHFAVTASPEALLTETPTNYRRWWNNSWAEVEEGGQAKAGAWTAADAARLKALVDHAHKRGFWIRFYTLDGFAEDDHGWGQSYNFGSLEAAQVRWKAAQAAGVNLIASDQYEQLAKALKQNEIK